MTTKTPNTDTPFGQFWAGINAHLVGLGRPELVYHDAREAWFAALEHVGTKRQRGELTSPKAND